MERVISEELRFVKWAIEKGRVREVRLAIRIAEGILNEKWSIEEVKNLLDQYAPDKKKRSREKCPNCGKDFFLTSINKPKSKQNLYGYKSKWICGDCFYEIYSVKSINEIIKEKELDHFAVAQSWRELRMKFHLFDLKNK